MTAKTPQSTGVQILILPDKPLTKINGILIPDKARKPTNSGIVHSVSNECEFMPGDRVCFNHNQGYEVDFDGVNYLSINISYLLAIKNEIMQPLNDFIFVEPIKEEARVSKGGVLMGEDQAISKGKVIHASKDKEPVLYNGEMILHEMTNLIADDIILFHKGRGIPYEKGLFLTHTDTIAIIN